MDNNILIIPMHMKPHHKHTDNKHPGIIPTHPKSHHTHISSGSGDLGPPSSPNDQSHISIRLDDYGRAHGGQGALPWLDKVGRRWGDAENVGDVGRGEVVHFVVEDDARASPSPLRAKPSPQNTIVIALLVLCGQRPLRLCSPQLLKGQVAKKSAQVALHWRVPIFFLK